MGSRPLLSCTDRVEVVASRRERPRRGPAAARPARRGDLRAVDRRRDRRADRDHRHQPGLGRRQAAVLLVGGLQARVPRRAEGLLARREAVLRRRGRRAGPRAGRRAGRGPRARRRCSRCGCSRRSTPTCCAACRRSCSCSSSGSASRRSSSQGVPTDPVVLGGVALALSYSAYVAEVYRAGIRLGPPEPARGGAGARAHGVAGAAVRDPAAGGAARRAAAAQRLRRAAEGRRAGLDPRPARGVPACADRRVVELQLHAAAWPPRCCTCA